MEPTTSDEALVPVFHTNNELDAQLYRAMLEGEGIHVLTETRPIFPGYHARPELNLHFRLLVYAHDAPRAAELIEDYRQQVESGALALPDDEASCMPDPPEHHGSRGALFIAVILLICVVVVGIAMMTGTTNQALLLIITLFVGLAVLVRLMTMP